VVEAGDVWRAELELAAALAGFEPGDARALERMGVRSAWDLRGRASRTRSVDVGAGVTARQAEMSIRVLTRARKVAEAVWPGLAIGLDGNEIAAVLDAAAGQGEARAIGAWQAWADAAAARGDIVHTGPSLERYPAVLDVVPVVDGKPRFDEAMDAYLQVRAAWDERLRAVAETVAPADAGPVAKVWGRTSPRRMTAVLSAVGKVGASYRFAQRGPRAFDCSGLTAWAWGRGGLMLKTSSLAQRAQTVGIDTDELRSGDLVLRASGRENPAGEADGHVALVLAVVDGSVLVVDASNVAGKVRVTTHEVAHGTSAGRVRLAEERIDAIVVPGVPVVWEPQR
jgi:hypothetical protein